MKGDQYKVDTTGSAKSNTIGIKADLTMDYVMYWPPDVFGCDAAYKAVQGVTSSKIYLDTGVDVDPKSVELVGYSVQDYDGETATVRFRTMTQFVAPVQSYGK